MFVLEKINEIINKRIWDPLDFINRDGKDYEFREVPGLSESGWTLYEYKKTSGEGEKSFEDQCDDIIKALNDHESAWPFRRPVSDKEAPDYYTVITNPMWLERVNFKLKSNQYSQRELFKRDILQIFENARLYNSKETIYFRNADVLQSYALPLLEKLKESKYDAEFRKLKMKQMQQ